MSAPLDIPVAIFAGGLTTRRRPITEKIPKSLVPFLLLFVLAIYTAGCRTPCQDCIPRTQMPYRLSDAGTNYYLLDHVSIDQMLDDSEMENFLEQSWIDRLKKRFPNDKELMVYVNGVEAGFKKSGGVGISREYLAGMRTDLNKSSGELYYYTILGKKKKMDDGSPGMEGIEEGYLILSKSRVYKKYIAAFNVSESLNDLSARGIK